VYLKHQLKNSLEYTINSVDKPLAAAITMFAKRYPEPTHENVLHPNSHILIDIKNAFNENWDMGTRRQVFNSIFKVVIVKYEQSPQYRNILDWVIMMIMKTRWKQFNPNRQMKGWKG